MKKITSLDLQKIVNDYKNNPSIDTMEAVFEAFWIMARNLFNHYIVKPKWKNFNISECVRIGIIRRMVFCAWIKLSRYDPQKGKAWNFISTVMAGWLIQELHVKYQYQDLKEKYYKKLEEDKIKKYEKTRNSKLG